MREKNSGFRRICISDDLERLHSEYVWELCNADALRAVDLENWWVFVNLCRGEWLAPLRPETVYDLVDRLKRHEGCTASYTILAVRPRRAGACGAAFNRSARQLPWLRQGVD